MSEGNICNGCPETDRCESIYRKMGNSNSVPILGSVLKAFVLPLVLFIFLLWAFGELTSILTDSDVFITFISFFASLFVTISSVILFKRLFRVAKS